MLKKAKNIMYLPGFAMLETILAIGLSALMAQFLISGMMNLRKAKQEQVTERNIEVIFQALAGYVMRRGCLPYPAYRNGVQFNQAKNEEEWASRAENLRHGIVPFRDLGLSENEVKNGNGEYFVYIVNVALCSRADVQSVTPGDPREYLDFGPGEQFFAGSIQDKQTFAETTLQGEFSQRENVITYTPEEYSSYRAVRSYENGQTDLWDIAFRLPETQIELTQGDMKLHMSQYYYLYPEEICAPKNLNLGKSSDIVMSAARSDKDKYKIGDCVAFVILNPKFAKYQGKNVAVGPGVYWQSRFGLISKFLNNSCVPAQIYVYDKNCGAKNQGAKPS